MTSPAIHARRHLWEYHHPYYGADGYNTECASFAELREYVDATDENMARIYRRDWVDPTQPYADDLFLDGEDRSTQTFTVYAVTPRTKRCISWSCPISHDQEAEVLAWLRSPRVLGALRTLWAPLLDDPEVTP
jgi:hypothetical protein